MLFTLNKSPLATNGLVSVLAIAPAGAPVLLYEDGVYGAVAGSMVEERMREALASHPVYALEADVKARGLDRLVDGVRVIGYDGFVQLVEEHDVVPWQ
jgi:tRNA 2-thiouridine synthesizing protein B